MRCPGIFAPVFVLLHVGLAVAGPCYKPNATLTGVKVWTNANSKWFKYPETLPSSDYYLPEIGSRPNLGIAVSGGGYRAVTLALGYVRALQMMNITQQARYLSSNSGGSWFNTAFSYQNNTAGPEFIGPYVPPQNLTMGALKDVKEGSQGAFARTIAVSGIKLNAAAEAAADLVTGSDRGPGAWSNSIGDAFLSPYELNADKSTFSALGTKGPVHGTLQQLDIKTYYYQGGTDAQAEGNVTRPFPIILGTIFDRTDNTSVFNPVEFTPLYIGCPSVFPNANPNLTIGGGFVDPVGFNSAPPNPPPTVPKALAATLGQVPAGFGAPLGHKPAPAAGTKHLRHLLQAAAPAAASPRAAAKAAGAAASPAEAPGLNADLPITTSVNSTFVVPLKIAAGISSSFLAQGLLPENNVALQELTGTEKLDYWNQVNFKGQERPFADGGGIDNLAVTPLLRRKVEMIVACIAGSEPIQGNVTIDDWSFGQWDISGLFGSTPLNHRSMKKGQVNGMTPQEHNRALQVFPESDWEAMFKAFKTSSESGGPAYHLATHTVLDNPYQAVHGGWKVKVLWVINAVQKNWEDQLPSEVQGTLAKSRVEKGGLYAEDKAAVKGAPDEGKAMGELKRFPYISTMDANYSPELVGLLSQQATWQMLQLQPQLTKLVGGSEAAVSMPRNFGTATTSKDAGEPTKTASAATGPARVHSGVLLLLSAAAAAAAALLA